MITVRVEHGRSIPLGRQGENKALCLEFDYSHWVRMFGDGVPTLLFQRPGDASPYACEATYANGVLSWEVGSTETAKDGEGRVQLDYIVDDVVVKSEIWKTKVAASLGELSEAPEPWQSWLEQLLSVASEAEAARDSAQTASGIASEKATSAAESAAIATEKAAGMDAVAEAARASAEAAATSASEAATSASAAATSEANAAASAAAAGGAVEDAEAAKTAVEGLKSDVEVLKAAAETAKAGAETARAGAESAKTDAIAAKTAAETAQSAAENAQEAAEGAQVAAEAAATNAAASATAAAGSATAAAGSATNAAGAATNAANSATAAAASASAAAASAEEIEAGGYATKAYVDAADALKAPLASPALTGAPTAPTPTAASEDTQVATKKYVDDAIAGADLELPDNLAYLEDDAPDYTDTVIILTPLTVLVEDGATVTITQDAETYTKTAEDGKAAFKVESTGTWNIHAVLGDYTADKTVSVATAGVAVSVSVVFPATITVNVDTGSTVTITKGAATQAATAANGKAVFSVEETGTYSVHAVLGDFSADSSATVSAMKEAVSCTVTYPACISVSVETGSAVTATKGSTTLNATSAGGVAKFYVSETGAWQISASKTSGGLSYTGSAAANVASLNRSTVSVSITYPAYIRVYASQGSSVTCNSQTLTVGASGYALFTVNATGTYPVSATLGTQTKTGSATVSALGTCADVTITYDAIINVSVDAGAEVTCTYPDNTTETQTSENGTVVFTSSQTGTHTLSGVLGTRTGSETVSVGTLGETYNITLTLEEPASDGHIYGISRAVSSSSAVWSRTDDAALFTDPVPYVAGASSYGSPFDNLLPWSGMVKSTREDAGVVVAIPKFWYLWTNDGTTEKLQIADYAATGFHVSPAHADRGDGKGERDVVYVGRYHSVSGYKSASGAQPVNYITRSDARSGIHDLGSTIWQFDRRMWVTIQMLYRVEFANMNVQTAIGWGNGEMDYDTYMPILRNNGISDDMPYHTGTMQPSRSTPAQGVQYRNIEDLWAGVYDWTDGCYNASAGLYDISNPADFSDSAGGVLVGKPVSGYPKSFTLCSVAGHEWERIPTASGGSGTTYDCDYYYFGAYCPCVCVGGYYYDYVYDGLGLFCAHCYGTNDSNDNIGCRLQILP